LLPAPYIERVSENI